MKYGVALFDNLTTLTGGVRCLDGVVGRFTGPEALDSAVIWLTNVPWAEFNKGYKLSVGKRFPNLRDDQFLRSRVPHVMKELGIADLPLPDAAVYMERLFKNTMTMTEDWVAANQMEADLYHVQRMAYALKGFITKLPKAATNMPPIEAQYAVCESTETSTATGDYTRGGIPRTYQLPRLPMAHALLDQDYPVLGAPWQHHKQSFILNKGIPAELEGRAVFCRLNLRNMDEARTRYAPFKRFDERTKKPATRAWAPMPEALSWVQDAEVEVQEAWSTELGKFTPHMPLPPVKKVGFSFSAGLFAESYLFALCPTYKEKVSVRNYYTGVEPIGAYLFAYERAYLLRRLKRFHEAGAGPTSFGSLKVGIHVMPTDVRDIDELAFNMGLEPPMPQVRIRDERSVA